MMNDVVAKFDAVFFHIAYAFTGREETRFRLSGVLIEPHPTQGVLMVATDGYRLIVIHDEDGFAKEKIIVRMDKKNLSLCRERLIGIDQGKELFDRREIEVSADGTAVVLLEGKRIGKQENAVLNEQFPNWRRVLPTGITEKPTLTALSGRFLGDFSAAAKRLTGSEGLFFAPHEQEPFIVNFSDNAKAFGIMMPMESDEIVVGLPDFMKKAMSDSSKEAV